jgi:hypothetical protein
MSSFTKRTHHTTLTTHTIHYTLHTRNLLSLSLSLCMSLSSLSRVPRSSLTCLTAHPGRPPFKSVCTMYVAWHRWPPSIGTNIQPPISTWKGEEGKTRRGEER